MKRLRYIIGAVAFALCSIAFAQVSKTSSATRGLYNTDVDDFMSVTDFTNVEPENIFAFTNFNTDGLYLGAAKKFGSVYTGLYLNGWFSTPYSTSRTTEGLGTTYTGTIKGSGAGLDEDDINSALGPGKSGNFELPGSVSSNTLSGSAILGISDIGIRLNFGFAPRSYTLKLIDGTNTMEYNKNEYATDSNGNLIATTVVGLSVGTKLDKESFVLAPWGKLSWQGYANNSELVSKDPTETVTAKTNNGYNQISVSGGVGMETKKEDLTHTFDVTLGGTITLYNKQLSSETSTNPLTPSTETTQKHFNFYLNLNPSYKLRFDPEERFSIALKADLPIAYSNDSTGPRFIDNVQQNYESSWVNFSLSPDVELAARWFAIPDKLTVNLGVEADFRNLLYYHYEATAHSTATNNWTFLDGGVTVYASTGVSFDFAKGITLDTSYNILRIIDSQLKTKLDSIWDTSMSFQLSVKL